MITKTKPMIGTMQRRRCNDCLAMVEGKRSPQPAFGRDSAAGRMNLQPKTAAEPLRLLTEFV